MSRARRPGFSLLEMILTLAIAMVLLSALYLALYTQLRQAEAGRELIGESLLVRSIFARLGGDVAGQLAPVDPRVLHEGEALDSGASADEPATNGSSGASSSESAASEAGGAADSMSLNVAPARFNLGVRGEPDRLVLSITRARGQSKAEGPQSPDLRRITYWLAGSASEPLGLAREELTQVTSDQAGRLPPDVEGDLEQYLVAPEVVGVAFEYHDGAGWQPSWDGLAPGPDGDTPIGPPLAIAVTLSLRRGSGDTARTVTYRHVIAVPTANNLASMGGAP